MTREHWNDLLEITGGIAIVACLDKLIETGCPDP